jgi:hypothetical protein
MLVSIKEKSIYGNVLMYPNNQTAQIFARLINKKTFSHNDLVILTELGYKIEFIKL